MQRAACRRGLVSVPRQYMGFMVDRSGTEIDFPDYVGLPLSVSFHQCTILVFNLPSILYLSQKNHELIFSIFTSPSNS
jgi:hypothetical protein